MPEHIIVTDAAARDAEPVITKIMDMVNSVHGEIPQIMVGATAIYGDPCYYPPEVWTKVEQICLDAAAAVREVAAAFVELRAKHPNGLLCLHCKEEYRRRIMRQQGG